MKYKKYTEEQVNQVKSLFEDGKNKCEISRLTGIPRGTLKHWLSTSYSKTKRNSYIRITDFNLFLDTPEKRKAYSFTLATYLNDGCISTYKTFRAPSLRLYNDTKYPINTQEWIENLKIVFPNNSVNSHKKPNMNCQVVLMYSKYLLDLFPQHGTGKKHERKLQLEDWQQKIINEYPEQFIRGCFQTDGCIYFQKYKDSLYKRYAFCNKSKDIIDFFISALKLKNIHKEPYFHTKKQIYLIQNFNKESIKILSEIIDKKE